MKHKSPEILAPTLQTFESEKITNCPDIDKEKEEEERIFTTYRSKIYWPVSVSELSNY